MHAAHLPLAAILITLGFPAAPAGAGAPREPLAPAAATPGGALPESVSTPAPAAAPTAATPATGAQPPARPAAPPVQSFPLPLAPLRQMPGILRIEAHEGRIAGLEPILDGDPTTTLPAGTNQQVRLRFDTKTPLLISQAAISILRPPGVGDAVRVGMLAGRADPGRAPVLVASAQAAPGELSVTLAFPTPAPAAGLYLDLRLEGAEEDAVASTIAWQDLEVRSPWMPLAIWVQPASILGLDHRGEPWLLPPGERMQLACWELDSLGNLRRLPSPSIVGFTANDAEIASVLSNGRLQAVRAGTTEIVAVRSGRPILHDRLRIAVPAGAPPGADIQIAWIEALAAEPDGGRRWQAALVNHGPSASGWLRVRWSWAEPGQEPVVFEEQQVASISPGVHLEPHRSDRAADRLEPASLRRVEMTFPAPQTPGARLICTVLPVAGEDPSPANNTLTVAAESRPVTIALTRIAYDLLNWAGGIGRTDVWSELIGEAAGGRSAFDWILSGIRPESSGFHPVPEFYGESPADCVPSRHPAIAWPLGGMGLGLALAGLDAADATGPEGALHAIPFDPATLTRQGAEPIRAPLADARFAAPLVVYPAE